MTTLLEQVESLSDALTNPLSDKLSRSFETSVALSSSSSRVKVVPKKLPRLNGIRHHPRPDLHSIRSPVESDPVLVDGSAAPAYFRQPLAKSMLAHSESFVVRLRGYHTLHILFPRPMGKYLLSVETQLS